MVDFGVAYAFSAGMVATVNPCGAVMLPAWVSYYLSTPGSEDGPGAIWVRVAHGLGAALVATLGFTALFLGIGLVVSLGGRVLLQAIPAAVIATGLALIAVGVASFFGRGPHPVVPGGSRLLEVGQGWRGVSLFGVGSALASLSCTLPIFLVVLGIAVGTGAVLAGLVVFLSYGVGMGVVLIALTVAAAVAKGAVVRGLRRVAPYVERASAVMLIGAGLYLVISWLPQLVPAG